MSELNFRNNEQVSAGSTLSIAIDNHTSIMTVSLHQSYLFEILGIVILVILGVITKLTSVNKADGVIRIAFIILLVAGILIQGYRKRALRCIINKSSGNFQYFRGGVLGSCFDKREVIFPISSINDFEMRRFHIWERRDQFQIFAILNFEQIDLSGKMPLDFSDCQKKAEMLRTFTNSKLSILKI